MIGVMTSEYDLEAFFADARTKIRQVTIITVTEIGGIVADELIERLNNAYPPASAPGESPHRRTGNLSAGIAHNIYEFSDGVTAIVTSDRASGSEDVPTYLEFGTEHMAPRPYMTPVRDDWETRYENEAAAIMQQSLATI